MASGRIDASGGLRLIAHMVASPGRGGRVPEAARRSGGPPLLSAERQAAIRASLEAGTGIRKTARLVGTGNATLARIAAEMRAG